MTVARRSAGDYAAAAWRLLATPDNLTVWQWQCRHGRIPSSESARPGPWLPEQAMLFRKALDIVDSRLNQRPLPGDPYAVRAAIVAVVGPSQIGKTKSFLHPIVAYTIDVLRSNLAFITHKQKQIRSALRLRFLPMFEETPALARYLPPTAALRRERLNASVWQLQGVNFHALCGNVASDLREYSHPVGAADEIEAWAKDVDGEGDPIMLFTDRQKRYADWSLFAVASTPNMVDGHAWQQICQGSHERLMVRCPVCGADQDLSPDQLRATVEDATPDRIEREDLAAWHCDGCQTGHESDTVDRLVAEAVRADRWLPGTWSQDEDHPGGHWHPGTIWLEDAQGQRYRHSIARWREHVEPSTGEVRRQHQLIDWDPPEHSRRSLHLGSYLSSPDCGCGRFLAHEIRAARGDSEQWKAHVNGWRAEPVVTSGEMLTVDQMIDATLGEHLWGQAPVDTTWLLITCDQQGNSLRTCWFPYEVSAVTTGGETWMVEAGSVRGFAGLEELEERHWQIGEQRRRADYTAVDGANGQMVRYLREWAAQSYLANLGRGMPADLAAQRVRRVLLVGSVSLPADVPWQEYHPTRRTRAHYPTGCRTFQWNNLHWKDRFAAQLRAHPDVPRLHLPPDPDRGNRDLQRYLKSCTSEERVYTKIGAPGGRSRATFYWQPRVVVNETGHETIRADTHWWDAGAMRGVLADLVGAHRADTDPDAPTTVDPPPPPAPERPTRPATTTTPAPRRRVSRLRRRH